jgi:hypothetical protein
MSPRPGLEHIPMRRNRGLTPPGYTMAPHSRLERRRTLHRAISKLARFDACTIE